jgi:two-component system, OmpR family, sensor histidine kinase QseC
MISLQTRLFLILVTATGLIWLFAIGWIYVGTRHEVEGVLDARLQEAARMVASLVPVKGVATPVGQAAGAGLAELPLYERQLSCQIWSLDGRLVARSWGAPSSRLSDTSSGFSERIVDGETWRVFTVEDADKGIRVLVGDRLGIREHLVADIIKGLLAPTMLIAPLLGFLIWSSLSRGLRPLRALAKELQNRGAEDMSPVRAGPTPAEILPMVRSLNQLFEKVEGARRHEREITAFAAHELRTPLAGLRTQVQVAIGASDSTVRSVALQQILLAVDRTTRLVRQLLAMANLDARADAEIDARVNLGFAIDEIAETVANRDSVGIAIDPALDETILTANAELLMLALRNLHENAVHHTVSPGIVRWSVESRAGETVIAVEDEGPGIPCEEMPLVTRRFFRGRYKSPAGSGLGLSIVELALRANSARLNLVNRTDRVGLRAEIIWPAQVERSLAQGRGSGTDPGLHLAMRRS